jgi:hypothetical protein
MKLIDVIINHRVYKEKELQELFNRTAALNGHLDDL